MIKKISSKINNRVLNVIIALLAIMIIAAFVTLIIPRYMQESQSNIIAKLDFEDPNWPARLIEFNIEIYKSDFPIYSAFTYDDPEAWLTLYYSTQAQITDIRDHYKSVTDNAKETGVNDPGNLNLEGEANGFSVKIRNYVSEVANIISIELDYTGAYSQSIREKLTAEFPDTQISNSSISHFARTEPTGGYVLYSFDEFATDSYAVVPVFSKRYPFEGSIETLNEEIAAVPDKLGEETEAVYGGNRVMLKENGFLFTVTSMEMDDGVYAVVTAQRIPA